LRSQRAGWSNQEVVQGRRSITTDTALRLTVYFNMDSGVLDESSESLRSKLAKQNLLPNIRALKKGGYYTHETSGSHVQMKHPNRPGRVTIPYYKRLIYRKHIVKSIVRQAGVTNQEFFELPES
jgi:predicted RNA binding protein YcfA (HicA-like mRNA interferase family)